MTGEKNNGLVPPRPPTTTLESIATAAKIALSAVPIVGGALAETINATVGAAVQKRRDDHLDTVCEKLNELISEGRISEERVKDPSFVDSLLQTAQAAVKTSIEVKRLALRNALLNSVLPSAPNEDLRSLFIRYIEEFSGAHLAILRVLQTDPAQITPTQYAPRINYELTVGKWLERDPALKGLPVEVFLDELKTRGLVEGPARGGALVEQRPAMVKLSELGKQFVVFVSDPTVRAESVSVRE